MNKTDLPNPVPIFRGVVQKATYKEQLVPRYRANPLIEALPSILSAEDSAKLLAYYPELTPNAQKLPPEIRMHLIMDILHCFQPQPIHLDLEQRVSRTIRDNYVGRDPLAKDQWINLDQSVSSILKGGGIPMPSSNVNGFSIIGIPGIGKTTGMERVLLLTPQVLYHESYGGKPFSRIQLTWLKITCPHDGSVKALCLEFFRAVDGVLDTRYYRDYGGEGRRTVDELIANMWRVAWIHCLGLLVIDEIQHLNQAKSGGAEKMLNFFLQLMNTLGVPVLMIGTYAAMEIFQRGLRQ
ncbi:MAG TPA: ATP-binding protein, partial [Puia sp.]|nr:ATP-binding protein [Puia sp.]